MTIQSPQSATKNIRSIPANESVDHLTVSIVIICRDNAQELRDTLASIRAQSSDRVQTIVVDGSLLTSDCAHLARNTEIVDDVISEPDEGIYDAMNKGIGAATSNVLLFLNSGDRFVKGFGIDRFLNRYADDITRTVLAGQTVFRLGQRRFICRDLPPVHQAMFFPRDAILRSGPYRTDLRIAGDVEFINRVSDSIGVRQVDDYVCEFQLGGVSTAPRTPRHVLMLYADARAVGRLLSRADRVRFLVRQFAKMATVRYLGFERAFLLTARFKSSWIEIREDEDLQATSHMPLSGSR